MAFCRAFWDYLKGLPLWKRVGFWVFNVGGVSYTAVADSLGAYRHVAIEWHYLLWASVWLFSVSTVMLVSWKVWQQTEDERARLLERLNPQITVCR